MLLYLTLVKILVRLIKLLRLIIFEGELFGDVHHQRIDTDVEFLYANILLFEVAKILF